MSRDYISGVQMSGLGPDSPLEKGRRFIVVDMGRFDLTRATATGYNKWCPGFRGRIIGISALVDTITTDTNADATIRVRINETNCTGGIVSLADDADGTDAVTPADRLHYGTALTDASDAKFDADDDIDLLYTVTNAFSDGVVRPLLVIEVYEA